MAGPHSWISDGPLRDIEKGLPITTTVPPALDPAYKSPIDELVSLLVDKTYSKELKKMYGNINEMLPEIHSSDPDNLSPYEKQFIAQHSQEVAEQMNKASELKIMVPNSDNESPKMTTRIPPNAHLLTWGGLIPYQESNLFGFDDNQAVKKSKNQNRVKTGITGKRVTKSTDASAKIRDLVIQSIPDDEVNHYLSKDESTQRPIEIVHRGTSQKRAQTQHSKVRKDDTIKECIHTYFNPRGIPFVPIDVEKYFPEDLLYQLESSTPKRKEIKEIRTAVSTISLDTDPMIECDPKSTLLDTSDQDILFTTNKTPFRRKEIACLRAFSDHWNQVPNNPKESFRSSANDRNKYVQRTFQSKSTFQQYLKLLSKDCNRLQSGLYGKQHYSRKTMWEKAVETAPHDSSSLIQRMKFWWKFCSFVCTVGGLVEEEDYHITTILRNFLMTNHNVDESLFYDILQQSTDYDLQCVSSLLLIEFLRIALNVEITDFCDYLSQRSVSTIIYNQTILSNIASYQAEAMNRIALSDIEIPEI